MIKADFKSRFPNDLESARKKRSKSIKDRSKSNKKDINPNKSNASSQQNVDNMKTQKIGSLRKTLMKQNKPNNQSTPKNLKIYRGDDVEQIQSMKFISKQCSSIKENHNDDCISFSNSGNNLDQFSPLFDRIEKENNSKQDFTLEICGIQDSDSYYQLSNPKDISFSQKLTAKQIGSAKSGRIKKNKIQNSTTTDKPKKLEFQGEILEIFKTLDHSENHILSKHNCSSEKLTTELNYLIGSILNKIKVKSKQYDYLQFENQFKSLIEDSEKEEILEILENNRKKRAKLSQMTEKDLSMEMCQKNIIIEEPVRIKTLEQSEILSPQFKKIHIKQGVSEKLNKISSKLNMYLAKNNLQTHTKPIQAQAHEFTDIKQNVHVSDHSREPPLKKQKQQIHTIEDQRLKQSKSTQKHTISTQNSNVSCTNMESFHKSHVTIKSNIEVIKKTDGSAFELNFTELNKHLD